MILAKDKSFMYFNVTEPGEFTDEQVYILDDDAALAKKAAQYFPYVELVEENGILMDVTPVPHEPPEPEPSTEERLAAVEAALLEVILNG